MLWMILILRNDFILLKDKIVNSNLEASRKLVWYTKAQYLKIVTTITTQTVKFSLVGHSSAPSTKQYVIVKIAGGSCNGSGVNTGLVYTKL